MLKVSLDTHLSSFHLVLNLSARTDQTTVLLGESGAGKSTILRLLAGLLYPERGHISLDDDIYFDSERHIAVAPQQRSIGYVFQDYVLFPHLSVFENVAFGLRAQRLSRSEVRLRVGEAMERVRLEGFAQRRPHQLSGGQQQRVALARALALKPRLLLLDEPLAALDIQTRREVRQELRTILNEMGMTTVMVTHQYLEALLFAHHIVVLDAGSVIQQGGQRDLQEYPRSSYVAELIGVNFFQGQIIRYEADHICAIRMRDGQQPFEVVAALKEHALGNNALPAIGEAAYVIVDPRSITLHPAQPSSSARNVFRGKIVQILRLNSNDLHNSDGHMRISVMLDDAGLSYPPITAEITEASAQRMALQEGQIIYTAFKATEASVYT
jgi:molybdate transport system ATP-binding protein